jgi:hypothetical protein
MSAVSLSASPDRDDDDRPLAGRPREFIQSLERGLGIIRAFGPQAPERAVSELAATTGLTRATTRPLLNTLMELGYLDSDGRMFWLTPRVLELGSSFLSRLRFPDVALPHLERSPPRSTSPARPRCSTVTRSSTWSACRRLL